MNVNDCFGIIRNFNEIIEGKIRVNILSKYITNVKCNLWSKQDDIDESLNSYKFNLNNAGIHPHLDLISFDDLYQSYKAYFKAKGLVEQKSFPIVSKQFFEKFLLNQLHPYINFEKFVSSKWLQA